MKLAMLEMYQELKDIGARIVLTVHDEVLVSCPKDMKDVAMRIISHSMIKVGKDLIVPIEIDIKSGKTWSEVHG
jgi:DNA polymerase-1